ncbi:MAG: 4-hydroxy-tetrahydrodipicolinate synthase [Candidatus Heimdallarchaeota archaeon]|nr:4-hydroxy-tetrahydrodipicolinate synthase [Candidatus Heimdallarchaeota archaeon]MBY8994364.1 4-hydroxy-tetrahydrodipicolinate synthase [Candidatus Heimdallarchaeota archaeon]
MAKKFRPGGVSPALVTPFTKKDEVDEEAYRKLIRFVIDDLGVTGIVPAGSTGEFSSLFWDEQKRIIEIAVEEANGKVDVMAGTGTSGTKRTIAMTKHAMDVGADAGLIVTPYYMKPTQRGLYMHYSAIASKVDFPIMLYQLPALTDVVLPRMVVEDLAVEHENIVGMKCSWGNMAYLMEILERVKPVAPEFKILCGWDEIVFPALAAGVDGCILASANFIGDHWVKIKKLVEAGKLEEARKAEMEIHKITRIIVKTGGAGTKEALNMMGVKVRKPRLPLEIGGSISHELRSELRLELERLGKIKVEPRIALPEDPKKIEERFGQIDVTAETILQKKLLVGEGFFGGDRPEMAHVDLLIGPKDGPVGIAFAKALALVKDDPSTVEGHEPLLALHETNEAVKPDTLLVPKVFIRNLRQASMVFGPVQAGVAKAVTTCVQDGFIPEKYVNDLVIIASVFVHPTAISRNRVYVNNRKATVMAIRKAIENRPDLDYLFETPTRHPLKNEP